MGKIVKEHNQVSEMTVIDHYEDHPGRTESEEFKKIKHDFHQEKAKCYIDNGYCSDGPIEIHHFYFEWASQNEIDWTKVEKDFPGFSHCDMRQNMIPLCSRHHRHKYVGVHHTPYNEFIMQKYLLPEPLAKFEAAVTAQEEKEKE